MRALSLSRGLVATALVCVVAGGKNLRTAKPKPAALVKPLTKASKSVVEVIGLTHRASGATPLRGTRKHKFLPPVSATNGNVTDKVATEVLAQFDESLPAYFAQLDFNGQLIDVLVDTGSSNLLIPATTQCASCDQSIVSQRLNLTTAGAQLVACEDPGCRGECVPGELGLSKIPDLFCGPHGGYCTTASRFPDAMEINERDASTSSPVDHVCLFYDRYGDGSYAAGFVAHSMVDLAGTKVDATYGAITGASNGFYEAPQGGGIMGMAFGGRLDCNSFSCFTGLFTSLIATHREISDVFAICGTSGKSSILLVGGGDPRLYKGEIAYVPLVEPYAFYSVQVQDVRIGEGDASTSLGMGRVPPPVIMDTGTSGIILPSFIYKAFKEHLQAHYCHVPYVCEGSPAFSTIFDDVCVTDPEGRLAELPPISIKVGPQGFPLNVSARQYMQRVKDEQDNVYYCLQLAGDLEGGAEGDEMFLIGETLLNHYYVEWDRVKLRLGFAEAVQDCAASIQAAS